MYDETVTIINKLKKVDSGVGATTDTWKKTVINTAEIDKKTVKNVAGNTVSIGESEIVLIPFNSGYLPYNTWKSDTTKGFTMNVGDLIIYGTITETPDNSNITSIKQKYENCDVRTVKIAKNNGVAMVQVKVEGV
jgi:hypothetical protein